MRSSERAVADVPADDAAADRAEEGGPRVRAMGDAAVLVELDDLDAVLAHAAAIEAAAWPGVVDVVPNTITPVDPNVTPITTDNVRVGPGLPGGPAAGPPGATAGPNEAMDVRLVEKPPRVLRSENPHFPEALRARGQNGRIVIQFVVDTLGRAEMSEFKVVDATDAQLADAVRAVLPRFRFTPGESAGHKVRTMVALPFDFTLVR